MTLNKWFVQDEIEQVDVGDGHTITIKSEMSTGDWERFESSMMMMEASGTEGNRAQRRAANKGRSTKISLSAGRLELLHINIVGWSFPNLPLTRENIGRLRRSYSDVLLDKIDELNNGVVSDMGVESNPLTDSTQEKSS